MESIKEQGRQEQEALESGQKVGSYTPLQSYFLIRLDRLLRKKDAVERGLDVNEADLRLLKRAIYAAIRDCVDEGVGAEASLILKQERAGS